MNTTVRTILIFLAAAVAAFAAAPPVDLPGWVAALIAALAAGFAGIGLLPPSWKLVGDGQRAVKKSNSKPPSVGPMGKSKVDDNKVSTISGQSLPHEPRDGGRKTHFAIAARWPLVAAAVMLFLAPAFSPTSAQAYLHVSNAGHFCIDTTKAPATAWFDAVSAQVVDVGGYGYSLYGGDNTLAYERISDSQVRVLCTHISAAGPYNGAEASANFVVGGSDGYEYTVSWYWCYQGFANYAPPGTYFGCTYI